MNHSPTDQLESEVSASSSQGEPPGEALSASQLETIERHLRGLPLRQKLTVRAAITKLKPSIERLRGRGYTVDEVAAELRSHGLQISARTLTRHLRTDAPKKGISAAQ